jgi:IS605 OrfB family transposase
LCNRIKKQQRKYGPQSVKRKWSYAKYLNQELSVKIAAAIVEFAKLHQVDCIVFEHLNMQSKKSRGKDAQRLHLWRKNGIQQITQHKAHKNGIRISRICANNTSALAYDGSGLVVRNTNNKALATFQNNKQYNCDLNASYNIGARYFIRELLKPVGATQRSQILAKVPELERRTSCTYHTLIELNKALTA